MKSNRQLQVNTKRLVLQPALSNPIYLDSPRQTPTSTRNRVSETFDSVSESHSVSTVSRTKSRNNLKKKSNDPCILFQKEFYKKANVKKVMQRNTVIQQYEAQLMLAYFRNVDVTNITDSDMALQYIQGKSMKNLKRHLRSLNETIRRTFYYGSDFQAVHEKHLQEAAEKEKEISSNHHLLMYSGVNSAEVYSQSMVTISEHIPVESTSFRVPFSTTPVGGQSAIKSNHEFMNLGESPFQSFSSLDDYLLSEQRSVISSSPTAHSNNLSSFPDINQHSNRSATNKNNINIKYNKDDGKANHASNLLNPKQISNPIEATADQYAYLYDGDGDDEDEAFDPLKGAMNILESNDVNIEMNTQPLNFKKNFAAKYFRPSQAQLSANDEIDDDGDKPDTPTMGNSKMFGKFFDKRGSNISHNSIWSESVTDKDYGSEYQPSDADSDAFLMAQMADSDDDTMDCDDDSHDTDEKTVQVPPTDTHISHFQGFSWASSVSLDSSTDGSENASSPRANSSQIRLQLSDKNSIMKSIPENQLFVDNENSKIGIIELVKIKSNSANANMMNKRILSRKRKSKKRKSKKIKQIDSALIDLTIQMDNTSRTPDNNNNNNNYNVSANSHDSPINTHSNKKNNYSLDSFLSDTETPPFGPVASEPTPIEKLKYHLTEPRLPPERRKTYNYF